MVVTILMSVTWEHTIVTLMHFVPIIKDLLCVHVTQHIMVKNNSKKIDPVFNNSGSKFYSGDGIVDCVKDACDHASGNFFGPDLNCEPMPINAECNPADSCITFICSHGYELNSAANPTIRIIFKSFIFLCNRCKGFFRVEFEKHIAVIHALTKTNVLMEVTIVI